MILSHVFPVEPCTMVEGVLSGVTLLLIVCAPIRVLGWLFDHGHPGSLLCCSGPVAGMVWDVIVFAFIAIVLLGIVNA